MHPGQIAELAPERPAIVVAGSDPRAKAITTFATLEAQANQLAHLFRAHGLRPGDRVAYAAANRPETLVVAWAAQRSGLHHTPLSPCLTRSELHSRLEAAAPDALVLDPSLAGRVPEVLPVPRTHDGAGRPDVPLALTLVLDDPTSSGDSPGGADRAAAGWSCFYDAVAVMPTAPIDDPVEGADLIYSSGTTGRPKGVRRPLTGSAWGTPSALTLTCREHYGLGDGDVLLSPGPLSHAAPLRFAMAAHRLGATVVLMDRFEPLAALGAMATERVTHSLWVPTMLRRILALDPDERDRFDLGRHRAAIHGAGPCSIGLKRALLAWWGPIVHEYYAGTEGTGYVGCTSEEWLARPGTVGRALRGKVHVVDESGQVLEPGQTGDVFFESSQTFEYDGDASATDAARDPRGRGWTTLGDIGHLDADGYLFLTDRRAFVIVTAGVNVAPQETEHVLHDHPAVADVAVIGLPDDDLGERVHALVVRTEARVGDVDGLRAELLAHCRASLSPPKCPRSIEFCDSLPRDEAGKLAKHQLRSVYFAEASTSTASGVYQADISA